MRRFLQVIIFILSLGVAVSPGTGSLEFIPSAHAASCVARENLTEVALAFIGRCRKASIHREFPSEMLAIPLGVIQKGSSATSKKAWKLLNDGRFSK